MEGFDLKAVWIIICTIVQLNYDCQGPLSICHAALNSSITFVQNTGICVFYLKQSQCSKILSLASSVWFNINVLFFAWNYFHFSIKSTVVSVVAQNIADIWWATTLDLCLEKNSPVTMCTGHSVCVLPKNVLTLFFVSHPNTYMNICLHIRKNKTCITFSVLNTMASSVRNETSVKDWLTLTLTLLNYSLHTVLSVPHYIGSNTQTLSPCQSDQLFSKRSCFNLLYSFSLYFGCISWH